MSNWSSTTRWSPPPSRRPSQRPPLIPQRVVFVCTHNSARSQLAAASWRRVSRVPAESAGTHPAVRVHPGAVAAGRRHGLRLGRARTAHVDDVLAGGDLVVAVCDNAHEELAADAARLHWSVPDPVRVGTAAAFDAAYDEISRRVDLLAADPAQPERLEEPVMTRPTWDTLTMDQSLMLRHAATRLAEEFDGVYGTETIERFLHSSFEQFADRATVGKFLPLMAERFARQRLRALAKIEGLHDDGKPVVLFLCTHNAGRSQMALGLLPAPRRGRRGRLVRRLRTRHRSQPGGGRGDGRTRHRHLRRVPQAVDRRDGPRRRRGDHQGCGDACPIFPGKRYEEWVLDDPAGLDVDDVRPIRDDVERRVRALLTELNLHPVAAVSG